MLYEVISVHVNNSSLGSSYWESNCEDLSITGDGKLSSESYFALENDAYHSFFAESSEHVQVPRCCYLDLNPEELNAVKSSKFHSLYHENSLVLMRADESVDDVREKSDGFYVTNLQNGEWIRRELEICDALQGFIVTGNSTDRYYPGVLDAIRNVIGSKAPIITYASVPSIDEIPQDPTCVASTVHAFKEFSDLSMIYDATGSQACFSNLFGTSSSVPGSLARFHGQVLSSLTSPLYTSQMPSLQLSDYVRCLTPMEGCTFVTPSIVGIPSSKLIASPTQRLASAFPCEKYSLSSYRRVSLDDDVKRRSNSKFVGMWMGYRVEGCVVKDITRSIGNLRAFGHLRESLDLESCSDELSPSDYTPMQFVDWSLPSIKYSQCSTPAQLDQSKFNIIGGLVHHSSISGFFRKLHGELPSGVDDAKSAVESLALLYESITCEHAETRGEEDLDEEYLE